MPAFDPSCIDVEDFLECLDIRNVAKATHEEYKFSCPFPNHTNGDENASAYMNEESTAFFCHGCKERGTAVTFTAGVLGISPLEAIRMLKQRYQPGGINPDALSMVEEVQKIIQEDKLVERGQPLLHEDFLKKFEVDWHGAEEAWKNGIDVEPLNYMFERGFTADTLTRWEFGFDDISSRITFAVRDSNGKLIGFKGRATWPNADNKYLVLGDKPNKPERYGFPCYFPSKVCFGAHKLDPVKNQPLVICEGEFNAIAVSENTNYQAIALNGSHFSSFHARIIRRFASKVILFLDDDKAGTEAVWGWLDKDGKYHPGIIDQLKHFVPVYLVPEHEKDAADLPADEIEYLLRNSESALLRSIIGV